MIYAPVLIPTLNRYEHFKQCLESLSQCSGASETEVYVALDYPAKESHREGYKRIKAYLEDVGDLTFKKLHVHKRDHNYGLGKNGNSATLRAYVEERYSCYILSEDDNVFAPNFLVYMNTCFSQYNNDKDVVAVCGYSYPVKWAVSEGTTVLRQQINVSTWGIGFWTDKIRSVREQLENGILKKSFAEVIGNKSYKKMIDACLNEYVRNAHTKDGKGSYLFQCASDIAMREYLVVANKFAITPVVSKVRNLGFDGTGAYCQRIDGEVDGKAARTYDYTSQPIDTDHTFSIVESTKDYAEENRRRLNAFDSRTRVEMLFAKTLLWESESLGKWAVDLTLHLKSLVGKMLGKRYIIIGAAGGVYFWSSYLS